MTRCTRHASERAAWQCTACGRNLCPKCAAGETIQRSEVIHCVPCGGVALELLARKDVAPYWEMFPRIVRQIRSPKGIAQTLGICVVMFLFCWVPVVGGAIALGVFGAYFSKLIHWFAKGEETLPDMLDLGDIEEDVLNPAAGLLLAVFFAWSPIVAWVLINYGAAEIRHHAILLFTDPVFVVLLMLGVGYFPSALLSAAVNESIGSMLNPLLPVRMVMRMPSQYLALSGTLALIAGIIIVIGTVVGRVLIGFMSLYLTLLLCLAVCLPLFEVAAFVLGRFVYQNAVALGFMIEEQFTVREYPEAKPVFSWPLPDALRAAQLAALKERAIPLFPDEDAGTAPTSAGARPLPHKPGRAPVPVPSWWRRAAPGGTRPPLRLLGAFGALVAAAAASAYLYAKYLGFSHVVLRNAVQVAHTANDYCAIMKDGGVGCVNETSAREGAAPPSRGAEFGGDRSTFRVQGVADPLSFSMAALFGCAVAGNGSVWCWGQNQSGQLGAGMVDDCIDFTCLGRARLVLGVENAAAVSVGSAHACALTKDGSIWCWGSNEHGQLGKQAVAASCGAQRWTYPCALAPVRVELPARATALSAGTSHTCAVLGESRVACWGANSLGQLVYYSEKSSCRAENSCGFVQELFDAGGTSCEERRGKQLTAGGETVAV
ncbi:MAG: hypothetical protein HY897_18390, partial [Deltaproteobacteria bacterium]|nr:hypothetical protein [Deltaproteobacteria bacterium]